MPRKRNRTTTKASWTVDSLENAVSILKRESISVYKVSQQTGIPYSTLKKRYNLAKAGDTSYKNSPKLGRRTVFNVAQEEILANHLRTMSNNFYSLTREQFRKVCYSVAKQLGIEERFNQVNQTAGKDWLAGFLQRHPDLSIRKPEAISINRILGFNKTEITLFFNNLEKLMVQHNFEPQMIYNVDETGITTVQETEKIIAPRGQKRVGSVTSWERGKTVTVICAMSASGSFIPPLFIFPRQRHSPHLEKDGPLGAVYTCSHNGWTNEKIFVLWLRHFIKHTKPTAETPVLIILDNHNSHATLEAWELAKENHVIMLTIPPHSSHRLQPLDVAFYSPLKRAYNKECNLYIKSRNLIKITPYEIAGLFNKAYTRVASIDIGVSSFKATGIFPMNPGVFSDDDFINEEVRSAVPVADAHQQPTNATPIPSTSNQAISEQPYTSPATIPSIFCGQQIEPEMVQREGAVTPDPIPSTSYSITERSAILDTPTVRSVATPFKIDFANAVSIFSPQPQQLMSQKERPLKNKQHSEIITSTPMKAVFEEKKKKRTEKEKYHSIRLDWCRNIKLEVKFYR
ncbi:unnamed protein product [Arctia plantaginis]|uniref:HTH CENPB-type domain-containing protein n=1 Tax=Arctia plantaginis TaxID=874455 RepID=A0A8S0ZUU3_ARCPL|nr:unnamed protein product [Arctia plantaginis]